MNKIYKPGECMKYMNIEIHPKLLQSWYCADVNREVSAAGAHVVSATDLCDEALVLWSRSMQPEFTAKDGQAQLTSPRERCDRALYVQLAEDISSHVHSHSLASHLQQVRQLVGCDVTLAVCGAKEYFKSSKRKTVNSNRKLMTEIELEMAITDLLVSASCDAIIVNTPNELALHIVQFTKAIAEAPIKKAKRECDEQADFYMRGDNKKCVAIDKDGNGMGRLWQQMIAILPMSSLETSRALCARYKSPQALIQALQSSDSVTEIADIGVARAAVPGARERRVGPEFARKLSTLFTAEDGNVLLD